MNRKLVPLARNLRKNLTETERALWKYLRAKQLARLKFRRQHPIGHYIVDFVCLEKRISIEVDGGQHAINKNKDLERNRWLQRKGFEILRFWDNEVLTNTEGVLEVIRERCLDHPHPTPLP